MLKAVNLGIILVGEVIDRVEVNDRILLQFKYDVINKVRLGRSPLTDLKWNILNVLRL